MTPDRDAAIAVASTFESLVGDTFTVRAGPEHSIAATLREVRTLPQATSGYEPSMRNHPFALTFEIADHLPLEQATYTIEHARVGALPMFLVRIGPSAYEAIFN